MQRDKKGKRQPNHRKGANIFSIITFAYTVPTFYKGFQRDLQEEDIAEHLEVHASKHLGDRVAEAWKKETMVHQHPSLWRVVTKVFGLEFFMCALVIVFLELVVKVSQPIALFYLIRYYSTGEEQIISKQEALMYTSIIVGASFITVIITHVWLMHVLQFGVKVRIALNSVIYRKSLRLSRSALGETSIGQIVNLLSNDVGRCDRFVLDAHSLWVTPVVIITNVCILYYLVGLISAVGVLFMALLIPLHMYMGKKTSVLRLKTALQTDQRVRLMNEIITGIQVIKMYTWEKPFAKLVAMTRRLEIGHIRGTSYIRGIIISFSIFTMRFAHFLTILTYVLLGNTPNADYVFIVGAFYNVLKYVMTLHFPNAIAQAAEFNVSLSRIQTFLLRDEIERINKPNTTSANTKNNIEKWNNIIVQLKDASAKWCSSSSENTLNKINFQSESEQLVVIIGPVGSGKSSLLHAILNELPVETGTVKIKGSISYASQEPWVFAGTVRQNILFGQPMILERYQEVIRVCALQEDFNLFPYADETPVGERGVTLSGGQKARVNLARAIYKQADIYLLDDPLSAVDTHVGKQLFEKCILGFLKNKCTILITHQLQYLPNINHIYLLEYGKISCSGTYKELINSGINFTKQLKPNEKKETVDEIEKEDINNGKTENGELSTEAKEQRSSGSVSADVYLSYFKAGGSLFIGVGLLLLFLLTQLSASGADYFLTYWVNLVQKQTEQNTTTSTDNFSGLSQETCVYIYSGITAFLVIVTLIRTYLFFSYCMKSSTKLHDDMFTNIVQAPMRFFNINPSGRILNRFSQDMGSIDEMLPMVTIDCIQMGLAVISVIVIVSFINPWMLIVTGIMLIVFYLLKIIYMRTSRSLKRLEGTTRSPIFSHISASLQGLTTVRAFGAENILQKEFDDHQNINTSVTFTIISCARAFGFWLDIICVIYMAAVSFSFFFFDTEQYGGNVGLAITQAMSLTGVCQWVMRQWSELENQMTSVERILEYTKIEHEINPTTIIPGSNWPKEGNINFISVSLQYSQSGPHVLKQVTFSIKSKEKIGIVGRTGAGKSSVIHALFQLSKIKGAITIDNIDITEIPLQSLRSKISIIPQEPILFSGMLRKNLDPFDEYPDVDLWNALEQVELKKVVTDLPLGLNNLVSEGGSNFSVGQRQLFCLARAIIRKNTILVLDEATANVDPQTDAIIQLTIKRKFADCTVVTIAHRLHTIMEFDKVLVMDAGKAIEFDHPHLLMQNKNGLFYALVQKTGIGMAESLRKLASASYKEKLDYKHSSS